MIENRPGRQPGLLRFGSDDEMVTSRLRELLEPLCVSEVARQTGASRQSIHRYKAGHPASVSFLVRLCEATETSAEWLLLGRGAPRRADALADHLAQASAAELCAALARRIDRPPQPKVAPLPRLVSDGA
jgi:transcriptional regulator with XRE-family HTH domain